MTWPTILLRRVARLESGHTPSRQHEEYWIPSECTIPWFSLADVWQLRDARQKYLGETSEKISPVGMANSAARLLPAGTVILSRTASVGFAGIMPCPMATTQDFANWIPGPRLLPDFLLYSLRGMQAEFERLRMGSTHQTIYMPDIRALRVPLPPVEAQCAIADFLDRKTAAIDALIEKKERLIALLQEKRQALITQAVTKGLDPNVPMKDSGIEWLGRIPAHWSVTKLGRMLFDGPTNGVSPSVSSHGGVPTFSISVIRDGRLEVRDDDLKWVDATPDEVRRYSLSVGDVLIVRGNGNPKLVARAGLVGSDLPGFIYPDLLMRLRTSRGLISEYLVLCFNSDVGRRQIDLVTRTTVGTYKVNNEQVRGLVFAFPPVQEQGRICAWLSQALARVERAGGVLGQQLDRLREYRQALITAAVTGQLPIPA